MKRQASRVLSLMATMALLASTAGGQDDEDAIELTSSSLAIELRRQAIAAGGGASSANGFQIVGTIGQFDSEANSSLGSMDLQGGFWSPAILNRIFRDGFESGDTSAWTGVGE